MIKVHLAGYDKLMRTFDRTDDNVEDALYEATEDAANYLRECVEDKFGSYQQTGGNRNGPWKKLAYITKLKKKKNGYGANANKPLVESGDMMFSLDVQTSNRTRKHTATVTSDDEKLLYHIYGAPSVGLPRRDPVRPTFEEERQNCFDMVVDAVRKKVFDKW